VRQLAINLKRGTAVKIRRIREVTIQTSETCVLRLNRANGSVTCGECPGLEMLPPEIAAAMFGLPPRWIYRQLEMGELHFQETSSGSVLVCPSSVQRLIRKPGVELGSTTFHD
jgi:hypothetical protein